MELVKDKVFDIKIFHTDFERLLTATSNKLEREFPRKFGQYNSAQAMFLFHFRVSINTYSAILFLNADSPKDPLRDKKFALASPPLVRTLYEHLISVIYFLHDTPGYIDRAFMSDYNEQKKELDFAMKHKAGDPKWDKYIKRIEKRLKLMERDFGKTEDEFKKIGGYPTPGNMIDKLKKDFPQSNVLPFIEFVRAWVYRELSSQTHLDIQGIQNKGLHFVRQIAAQFFGKDNFKERREIHLEEYRTGLLYYTFTLLLAIMSEMNWAFSFNLTERLIVAWEVLTEYSDTTKDFYNFRYKKLLKNI